MIAPPAARRAARRPRLGSCPPSARWPVPPSRPHGGGRPARAASEDFNVPPAPTAAVMGPAGAALDGAGSGPAPRPRAARPGRRPL